MLLAVCCVKDKLRNLKIVKMTKEIEKTKSSLRRYRKYTLMLSILGFALSYYSVWVELSKELDPNYKAFCDFAEGVSCSAVFTSK